MRHDRDALARPDTERVEPGRLRARPLGNLAPGARLPRGRRLVGFVDHTDPVPVDELGPLEEIVDGQRYAHPDTPSFPDGCTHCSKSPAVLDRASYARVVPYEQWQFRLGLHGLAILRTGTTATDEQLAEHVSALSASHDTNDAALAKIIGGTERDVSSGYERWASVYDAGTNPLIGHEQPVVHGILATWPAPLRVLDAACGTGRHTVHLAGLGHDVTGVDASPAMLAQAAEKRKSLALVEGNIEALPFPNGAFDAAVCAPLRPSPQHRSRDRRAGAGRPHRRTRVDPRTSTR